jgi:hypothetical protein
VQQEKKGLPLPPTPEDTSSGSDTVWSKLEREEEEDEVPLASGDKGKKAVVLPAPSTARAGVVPASKAGATLAGEVTATRSVPGTGGAPPTQTSKKRKRQVSSRL